VEKASGEPSRVMIGKVTAEQVAEIAKLKMNDLNANDLQGAIRQVEGTARSMGIEIAG